MQLFETDFVRLLNGEIADSLDTIYAQETLEEMIEYMSENGLEFSEGEEYVSMTSLTKEQQKTYLDYLKKEST